MKVLVTAHRARSAAPQRPRWPKQATRSRLRRRPRRVRAAAARRTRLPAGRPHRGRPGVRDRARTTTPSYTPPPFRTRRTTAARRVQNNLMATFNVLEAAVRFGVPRFVNLSSETVPGFFFPERPFLPRYAPVDEEHRSIRRTRTPCPSSSARSCVTPRCSAATSAVSRSARATCSTRATTSGTWARRCATPAC